MSNRSYLNRKILIIGAATVLVLIAAFFGVRTFAQNQTTEDLVSRLNQRGISVQKIIVTSRYPFWIDITLQGSSTTDVASSDDVWAELLTEREARLAYRIGIKIDSFTLRLNNANGKEISYNQYFLYEENRKVANLALPPNLDDSKAKQNVIDHLKLGEIKLTSVSVISDNKLGNDGQVLTINGVVPDLEAANRTIIPFIDSFKALMWGNNSDHSIAITLCRVRVNDAKGNMILDYMIDGETGAEIFGTVPGLTNEFYPHPAPTGKPVYIANPTSTQTLPLQNEAYPAPSPSPIPTSNPTMPYP